MGKASSASLDALHGHLARVLAEAIEEKEPKVVELPDADAEGGKRKAVVMVRNAAVLSVARQFLKDNGIEGPASPGVGELASKASKAGLLDDLPFPTEGPSAPH